MAFDLGSARTRFIATALLVGPYPFLALAGAGLKGLLHTDRAGSGAPLTIMIALQ